MSNYSTNDTPVGVGYNSDGEARAFVELSAVSVGSISSTTVSATEYLNIDFPVTRLRAGAGISLSPVTGLGEVTITNTGGGGGGSLPAGNAGDILVNSDGASLYTAEPLTGTGGILEPYALTSTLEGYLESPTGVTAVGDVLLVGPTGGQTNSQPPTTFISNNNIVQTAALASYVNYNATTTLLENYMEVDPYFTADDDGAVAQWDGTKLEVKFPDAIFIRVTQDNTIHSGENISKGDAVYATTTTESGGRIYVGLANAADPSRMPAIGIAEADINAGNSGKIISFGRADGVDTTLDGTATVGDTLYVGTTNGKLAANKPDQSSELIQNVGIVTQAGTSGRIKVTGVGRSNDIPNDLDVVGSVTVGDTVISQTTAVLSNADQNSVMITDGASAVSSVSGASGSIVYFEGATPAPGLKTFAGILTNEGYNISPDTDYATESFVTTQGYITSITGFDLVDLGDVTYTGPSEGDTLVRYGDSDDGYWGLSLADNIKAGTETIERVWVSSTSSYNYTFSNVLLTPANTTGKGDVDTGFVFLSGTDASSTEVVGDNFGKIWVTGPDQDISDGNHLVYFSSNDTTSGTAAITVSDEALTALQTTPSYFQVISSGNITGVADEALTELGWASTGTYALSDPGGNLSLESGDSPDRSVINVSGDGVYQIDATVRISNTTERGGIVFRIYRDTGSGFTDIPELRASNYASRGTGSGEGITNGSCSINTILSLNANDRLQFRAQPKTAGATSIIQQEGTYLRIIKIA